MKETSPIQPRRRKNGLDHPENPGLRWCRYCGMWKGKEQFRVINTKRQGAMRRAVCDDCNMSVRSTATISNARKVYQRIACQHVPSQQTTDQYGTYIRAFIDHIHVVHRRQTMHMVEINEDPEVKASPYRLVRQFSLPLIQTASGMDSDWYIVNTQTKEWDGPQKSQQAATALIRSRAMAWNAERNASHESRWTVNTSKANNGFPPEPPMDWSLLKQPDEEKE